MSEILDKMKPLPCAECGEPNTQHHVCASFSDELLSVDWIDSCDNCKNQEEGGHYCLLRGETIKDMNTVRCKGWENR